MNIREKSIAELIDSLCTVSQKCFKAQDDIMDKTLSDEKRLDAAIRAQKMNSLRTQLMIAINESLGHGSTLTEKTYHTYLEKEK